MCIRSLTPIINALRFKSHYYENPKNLIFFTTTIIIIIVFVPRLLAPEIDIINKFVLLKRKK